MDGDMGLFIATAAGVLFGVLIVAVILKLKSKGKKQCEYDERQILARGKAYKLGFLTFLFYYVVYNFFQLLTHARFDEYYMGSYLGIFAAAFVFISNAIWNDAYLKIQERAKGFISVLVIVALFNFLVCILHFNNYGNLENSVLNLFAGILLLLIIGVFGLKAIRDRHQEEVG